MAWLLGVIGGVATVVGLVILLAGDDQYVGIGGDWSWRVGDINAAWGWCLLVGGVAILVASVGTVLRRRQ